MIRRPRTIGLAAGVAVLALYVVLPSGQRSLLPIAIALGALAVFGWRGFPRTFRGGIWPVAFVILLLGVVPALFSIVVSFFDVSSANLMNGGWRFIGLERFARVTASPDERAILLRTLLFGAACVLAQFAIGVPWGVAIARKPRLNWVDGLLVLPIVMPPIITALGWRAAFDDSFGIVRKLLLALGLDPPTWLALGSRASAGVEVLLPQAMIPSIAAETWQWAPFVALFTALSLRQIPANLRGWAGTAARSRWRTFRVVELPLIAPSLVLIAFLRLLDSLKSFESIWVPFGNGVLTATESIRIATHALEIRDYSTAAALSTIMLAFIAFTLAVVGPSLVARRRPLGG